MTHAHHDHANDHAMPDGVREDPPNPDLDQLQQREPVIPAVPVQIAGTAQVRAMPALRCAVTSDTYVQKGTGQPDQILAADPKRVRALLFAEAKWFYLSNRTGTAAPIPANVVLDVRHTAEAWAAGDGAAVQITAIMEFGAD
jgi:hypothetical protein